MCILLSHLSNELYTSETSIWRAAFPDKIQSKIWPSHTFWTLSWFLFRLQLICLFILLIKRNNRPQKYSEANTTENKSTVISRSFYICLKQIKQNPWQDLKPKHKEFLALKDSTMHSKDQIICGSWKEQLIFQGKLYIAEEVRIGETLFPFPTEVT